LLCRRADQHEQRALAGDVLEGHLLGEEIVVERGHGGLAHAGRCQQQHAVVQHQDDERHLHLAVDVEQGGGAALARRQRGDVVAQQRVEELRAVAARDLDDAEVGAVDDADGVARGTILGETLVVWHGVHCTRRVLDCAPWRRRRPPSARSSGACSPSRARRSRATAAACPTTARRSARCPASAATPRAPCCPSPSAATRPCSTPTCGACSAACSSARGGSNTCAARRACGTWPRRSCRPGAATTSTRRSWTSARPGARRAGRAEPPARCGAPAPRSPPSPTT